MCDISKSCSMLYLSRQGLTSYLFKKLSFTSPTEREWKRSTFQELYSEKRKEIKYIALLMGDGNRSTRVPSENEKNTSANQFLVARSLPSLQKQHHTPPATQPHTIHTTLFTFGNNNIMKLHLLATVLLNVSVSGVVVSAEKVSLLLSPNHTWCGGFALSLSHTYTHSLSGR